MSSIRLRTLSDFMARGMKVKVYCRSCGHSRQFDPTQLQLLFIRRRWSGHVHHAQRQFRCVKCGTKNCELRPGGFVNTQ